MPTDNVTITTADGSTTIHRSPHDGFDGGAFFAGVFATLTAMMIVRFVKRRRARLAELIGDRRDSARFEGDYAALAERTATLERIVTAPATRLDREIDALR